jgi:hypothetical protein
MSMLRIAARVASYMYSDGVPHDGTTMNKNLGEIYAKHAANKHKIDLTQIQKLETPPAESPDVERQ